MNNSRIRFMVLLFCDPHLLEGGKRCQDRASNPHGVFSIRGRHNFDQHTTSDTRVHGITARQNDVDVSLRMSTSHFIIELWVVSWMLAFPSVQKTGLKRASGQRKNSSPMVIICRVSL